VKQEPSQGYKVSISSTFYASIFCTNIFLAAFLKLHVSRKAAKTTFVRKIFALNVDEIDPRMTRRQMESSFFAINLKP
jgi:hypothetical protein